MCPLIRKHNGYVDQYTTNGFIALFNKRSHAVAASIELQMAMDKFNSGVKPFSIRELTICSAIHSSSVVIGVVGDNGRMQGVLLTEDVELVRRVMELGVTMESKVVVTGSIMRTLKKGMNYRHLGVIHTVDNRKVEIYDLLDGTDHIKSNTKAIFSQAVTLFAEKNYVAVAQLLSTISSYHEKGITKYLKMTEKVLNISRMLALSWTIQDTLLDPIVCSAFETYCNLEHSTENIRMWHRIREYSMLDHKMRKKIGRELILELRSININDKMRSQVEKELENEIVSSDLVVNLQYELENIMKDSHARFKQCSAFMNALCDTVFSCNA
jgi:hypothetical protein